MITALELSYDADAIVYQGFPDWREDRPICGPYRTIVRGSRIQKIAHWLRWVRRQREKDNG